MSEKKLNEQVRLILSLIEPFFNDNQFEQRDQANSSLFVKHIDNAAIICGFNWKSQGYHEFGSYMWLPEVSNNILEIGLPNMDLSSYIEGGLFFSTIKSPGKIEYNTQKNPIQTNEACNLFCNSIISFFENTGFSYYKEYSYIPNILKKMNNLQEAGKLWSDILASNGPEYFWQGLIISKLCNDINFSEKIKFVDSIYYDKQYRLDEWIPYYERLKERLKTIEPKYNL
ncbi:hypothetical protein [Flavobacterium panacagri]|uniref:hypothetical protein n=1 Tax=Flavobacterium panacagri TaxID=3034146 RepID=UPI0025A59811|nr:hypothetical protein [Flavobacterium panacagri]